MPLTMIFDTETTGLPIRPPMYNTYHPPEDTKKYDGSRVVECAYSIVDDTTGEVIKEVQAIIKPNGEYTTDATMKFHGISTLKAETDGRDRKEVLDTLSKDLVDVEKIVGHNVNFDYHILASELIRSGYSNFLASKKRVCTMEMGQKVMRITKSPGLGELYKHLFKKPMEDAHSAKGDTKATLECYYKMVKDTARGVQRHSPATHVQVVQPTHINVPVIREANWTFASHRAALPEVYAPRQSGPVNMNTLFS